MEYILHRFADIQMTERDIIILIPQFFSIAIQYIHLDTCRHHAHFHNGLDDTRGIFSHHADQQCAEVIFHIL